jgi:hypothetical protein
MTKSPICICKPEALDDMCPIEEHRTRAEMRRLQVVGSRSGVFDFVIEDMPVKGVTTIEVHGAEPTDGGGG